MLDLNGKEFAEKKISIFNGGVAGAVDNTTISVEKKKSTDPQTYPDYKLIVEDEDGQKINQGFYYPSDNPQKDAEANKKRANMEVGRVLSIARAVVGTSYEFPAVNGAKEAFDTLFKIIHDNAGASKFRVFVTYGQVSYPSKYLGLRYFDFIEPSELEGKKTKMTAKPNDLMERITPDEPQAGGGASASASTPSTDWFN
jgi:hypothetical protein